MIVISYQVTLLEPLLATRIAGDPNSAVSYPYVPGGAVRGALVAAYMREKGIKTLDADQEEARRLFFNDRTRYLNAYPVAFERKRMLPTPLTWFSAKGEEGPIFDFAHEVRKEIDDEPKQFSVVAGSTRPFCWFEDGDVCFYAPLRRVNVHTQRDRIKGRAIEGAGAVFQYDALEESQIFAGYVISDNSDDAPLIRSLLTGLHRFGGSSNSGYGRVQIIVEETINLARTSWREASGSAPALAPNQPFVITLFSNTLVRDPSTGQHTANLKPALERSLGVTLHTLQRPDGEENDRRSGWNMEEVGGFNRTWGLPLPQAQAISAGSVFIFVASQAIESTVVAAAEWQGIGERRAEGFGRLAFDWQVQAQLGVFPDKTPIAPAPIPELTGAAHDMATLMATRMLRRDLDNKLRKRINDLKVEPAKAISNAQLSRFRVIARDTLLTGDTERLIAYLEGIRQRRSAREQFERSRVFNQRFVDWLKERLDNPSRVWQDIGAGNLERQLGTNVRIGVSDDEALAREYTIRLIDGLLAKTARTRREEEDTEQ